MNASSNDLSQISQRVVDAYPPGIEGADIYIRLAHAIFEHFIGKPARELDDGYFYSHLLDDPSYWGINNERLCSLADSLFILKDCIGFDVLVARLQTRPIRSGAIEATVAATYASDGFEIFIRKEIGIIGEDFDFKAAMENIDINVEVSELIKQKLSRGYLKNKLSDKRGQFPASGPNVLVLSAHAEWWHNELDRNIIATETEDFLKKTRRVNMVVYRFIDVKPVSLDPEFLLLETGCSAGEEERYAFVGIEFSVEYRNANPRAHVEAKLYSDGDYQLPLNATIAVTPPLARPKLHYMDWWLNSYEKDFG